MQDTIIITPFFLDEPWPRLGELARPGDRLNDPEPPGGDTQDRMSSLHEGIARRVEVAIRSGQRPVSIAGDCCSTIGVAAGLQRAGVDPFLVWFDAHGDFNTWETTPSGFLGGMPLAMLVGRGEQRMLHAVGLRSLSEERIILTDGRDLDPGERERLERSGLRHLSDPKKLMEERWPASPLYVHLDTDILDPRDAPAVDYPVPGGPRLAELDEIFRFLARNGRIVAVSMSTWNPELDEDGQTAKTCMQLLPSLLAPSSPPGSPR